MRRWTISLCCVLLACSITTRADILFEDDFEADDVGDSPAKWDNPGTFTLEVDDDPAGGGNQVLLQEGEWEFIPMAHPKNTLNAGWTDYIWEYDWYWEGDDYYGTAQRFQDDSNYYHFSRRLGFSASYFLLQGDFIELINVPWQEGPNIWFRFQISMIGDEHVVKVKERDDATLFTAIDPIIEISDDTFDGGTIGLFGGGTPVWWDNMIVYEPGTNIFSVDPRDKSATTWGSLKATR